ncbi:MAG: RNA 2',3'-cyclic phosphodiesterase [Halanaerobiales bacterium]
MRLFIAINLIDQIKKDINNQLIYLKRKLNSINLKWVKTDNMHITLKFLGEVSDDKLDLIYNKMDQTAELIKRQSVQTGKIAAFPHPGYPRVIYLGLKKNNEELIKLHSLLEERLKTIGFEVDKNSYIPHITLARTKRNTDMKQLSRALKGYLQNEDKETPVELSINIDKISLIKSILERQGPIYQEIYTAELL